MTREELEKMFTYHMVGAALEFQDKYTNKSVDSSDVYEGFEAGAEWAQKFMIKRACEWLLNNAHLYVYAPTKETRAILFDNFKKTMEE